MDDRLEAYVLNVERALERLVLLDERGRELVELARSYLSDAKYYLEKGDRETSLACIAYAEGLLDALKRLGLAKLEWEPLSKLLARPKVMVAGSFEILHPGHIYLLRKAWEIGNVHVVVSRDANFARFKGREPAIPERQRLEVVSSVKYVGSARLGDEVDLLRPVEELRPDVIVLGPDQWTSPSELEEALGRRGLGGVKVLRLENKLEGQYYSTSKIIKRIAEMFACRAVP
ncbi:MAG: DUF357 domain-containing protein [Desulfurococcaceae archaeon]